MTPNARTALAAGRRPVVVCLLRLRGGTVYAFGTEQIEIPQRGIDTATIQASAGLVVDDMESALDPFALTGETSLTQAQVSVVLPTSLAGAQGDWRYIGAATAELARVWPGDAWQDRESLLAGTRLAGVSLGIAGEQTTFTIEAVRSPSSAMIGDASRTIGADFPAPIDVAAADLTSLEGVEYPQIHGAPYRSVGFKIGEVDADNYDRVLIAGHHVVAALVAAYNEGVLIASFSVLNTSINGQDYAYIRSNVAGTLDASTGAITIGPAFGGIANVTGTEPILSLGELLHLWLTLSGLDVNWGRTQAAIDALRAWPGGVYFDAATPAIEAIRDHILTVAPLIEMQSADGLWFYYADLTTPRVRGVLTEGQELIGSAGPLALTEIEDIRNSVTVRYAYDEFTGRFSGTVTVEADTDALAYVSDQLYGALPNEPIDAYSIKDATTARRVGRAVVHRRAAQRRMTRWLVSDWAECEIGEVYRVIVPSLAIDQNAVVTNIAGIAGRVVTFTVLDGPL